jgi:hypothetical protein
MRKNDANSPRKLHLQGEFGACLWADIIEPQAFRTNMPLPLSVYCDAKLWKCIEPPGNQRLAPIPSVTVSQPLAAAPTLRFAIVI